MTISSMAFDNEADLQNLTYRHLDQFFGDCLLLEGFRVTTQAGKGGVPDGFAFNFSDRSWWLIECELLRHGVWPHIAEQLTRFVVALRNRETLRKIRDRLFDRLVRDNLADDVASALETDRLMLFRQLELFIEGITPTLAVFIDSTNSDLEDACSALDIPTAVFRVQTFLVNGNPEFHSPDSNLPVITSTPSDDDQAPATTSYDIVERLGGGSVIDGRRGVACYAISDGRVVHIKKSKFHVRQQNFWYGVNPNAHQQVKDMGCTDYVFVMHDVGFVVVPVDTVDVYLSTANRSPADGEFVKHFHVFISLPPEVSMIRSGTYDDILVAEGFEPFG